MNRNEKFGRLLAIANVLGSKVFDKDELGVSEKHLIRYGKKPALTLERIHQDLIKRAGKFGEDEMVLLDMFGEIMGEMDETEFTNEPLEGKYLQAYHSQQHELNGVMSVKEAAKLWNLEPGTVKNYCSEGKVLAKKIGRDWAIPRSHPNPKQSGAK